METICPAMITVLSLHSQKKTLESLQGRERAYSEQLVVRLKLRNRIMMMFQHTSANGATCVYHISCQIIIGNAGIISIVGTRVSLFRTHSYLVPKRNKRSFLLKCKSKKNIICC